MVRGGARCPRRAALDENRLADHAAYVEPVSKSTSGGCQSWLTGAESATLKRLARGGGRCSPDASAELGRLRRRRAARVLAGSLGAAAPTPATNQDGCPRTDSRR